MKLYSGTKLIKAIPMTRLAYNVYRSWQLPENKNGDDEGFLVEYIDGGKPNDERHDGYISWSPNDVFENAYRENGQLTFGDALIAIKQGKRVSRSVYRLGAYLELGDMSSEEVDAGRIVNAEGYYSEVTARDLLAEDWHIKDE